MEEDNHWLNRWGIPVFCILMAGILLASFLPLFSGTSARATGTRAVNQVKQLLLGCRSYAADHEGEYPPNLKVLYPDYVDDLLMFEGEDEKFRHKSPMIYYPRHTEKSAPEEPLIEHPFKFDGKKVIGYISGHVRRVK